MKQSIHLFPKIPEVDKIRRKYDSFYKKFKTHITLVYVFELENQKELLRHVKKSIEHTKPFEIAFGKFYASSNYVCLKVKSEDCWKLYKSLNRDVLAGFGNKEVEFQPHISIAVLENPEKAKALEEKLNKEPPVSKAVINSVCLSNLNDDFSIKSKKTFKLS